MRRAEEREADWGTKMHVEMKTRGELIRVSESKFEALVVECDFAAEQLQRERREKEKEMAALQVTHEEGARKAEGVKRELGQVLGELNHTRETLCLEEEERKKLESKVGAVPAELVQAEKSKEAEDVEMGGTGSLF